MKILFFILIFFSFSACGDSPLLNHKVETAFRTKDLFKIESEIYEFMKVGHDFSLTWSKGPGMSESKFTIKTWNKNLGSVSGPYENFPITLKVYLWMPDMGHGSADVKINQVATGQYEVSNVYFIMKGTWEIHFELVNGAEVIDEVIVPITL